MFEESGGGVLFFEEVDHFGFFAGAGAEAFNPVGVGKEADIKEHIGVHGGAVFEAKGEDGDAESFGFVLDIKGFAEALSELARFEEGGIEDQVGFFAERGEQSAFAADAFGDGAMVHGMGASAFGITAGEDIVLGIEEEETSFVAELLEECAKGLGFVACEAGLAGIRHDGDAFKRGVSCFEGFEEVGEKREREVVNAEVSAVFEGFGSDAFSRAAHSGNNHKVANHNHLRLCGRQNG